MIKIIFCEVPSMSYPSGHREQVRKRIVDSARRLFNRNGFEGVSVDGIMAQAGLTRGAFYSYFKSKSDLYAETLTCFFTDPNWDSRWEGVEVDLASPDAGSGIIRAYLSRQHLENVENSCPMVALPGDVARCDSSVKSAFEAVVKAMVAILGRKMRGTNRESEETAMAIAALVQFAEWEEWVTLVVGLAVAVSPWVLGFAALHQALAVCVVLGLIVALASAAKIWSLRHPAAIARR